MRDKVLCVSWVETKAAQERNVSLLCGSSCFLVLPEFFTRLFLEDSVPVSIQGGVKMSIDEFMSFLDRNKAWVGLKAERHLEKNPRKGLDTIFATESLFRGSVVDFGELGSHSGGGSYADNGLTFN